MTQNPTDRQGQCQDVIIVGGGPSGLALAYRLSQKGVSALILEKGDSVGQSWGLMPEHLRLVSPLHSNILDSRWKVGQFSDKRQRAGAYFEYLQTFSKQHKLNVLTRTEVLSAERSAKGFTLSTSRGKYECQYLVWATGYFCHPYFPDYVKDLDFSQLPYLHFSNFQSAAALAAQNVKKVLIVGKRLSAGQLLEELNSSGIECALSVKSDVQFMVHPFLFNLFFRFMLEWERLILTLKREKKFNIDVKMEQGHAKRLIDSGKVQVYPEVASVRERTIVFDNGSSEDFDMVIFATGFRPHFRLLKDIEDDMDSSQLNDGFEVPSAPNLFLLGYNNQVNFRSRFVRGIREDAKKLAVLIAGRVVLRR